MRKVKQFNPGSANFESHYLEATPEYIKVKPAKKLFVFYSIFAIIGAAFAAIPLFAEYDSSESVLPVVAFGAIFFLIGMGAITASCRRRYPYIDLRQRMFYPLGKENKNALPGMTAGLPLSDAEIDISSRVVRGRKNSYTCYTLALLFPGNKRFILLNHGSSKAFMRDTGVLARYTGLALPPEDFEAKRKLNNMRAAPFLLIFGLFWTGLSFFMHWQTWQEKELFPIIFTGIFVLIGVMLLGTAVKLLIALLRNRGEE